MESISTLVPTSNQTIKRNLTRPVRRSPSQKKKLIDLSGDYVSNERDEAKIEKKSKAWKIDYQTADGKVSAEFSTDWKVEGSNKVSTGKMKKSDGNTDFTVTVRVFKYKTDKKPLITVTMSDKNPDHEMVFANREDFFKSTDPNDIVLDGNLSPFEGAYSNDAYEKEIADSGFKLYGYTPEEYYQNKTKRLSKHCKMGRPAGLSGAEALGQVTYSIKKKSPRSEKAIMKFISLGQMGLRSKGKSKPCT